jgi:hypothetical protein
MLAENARELDAIRDKSDVTLTMLFGKSRNDGRHLLPRAVVGVIAIPIGFLFEIELGP